MTQSETTSESAGLPRLAAVEIAVGRGLLADGRASMAGAARVSESHPVAMLLVWLWDEDSTVRKQAALALAGGSRDRVYMPDYGHFAGSFLRVLATHAPERPAQPGARAGAVVAALREMLDNSASEIRAMSNMSYSFLSSSLYVALFATCRDTLEATRRLRASETQAELCRLLWSLSRLSPSVRLNGQDMTTLAQIAGRALAAFPPDAIPDFWHALTHSALPRRLAVAPALPFFASRHAVPALLAALPGQPPAILELLLATLGRIGDRRALPALLELTERRNRALRAQAQAAITQIEKASRLGAPQTLLRASWGEADALSEDLLRPAPGQPTPEPPEQLLRLPEG